MNQNTKIKEESEIKDELVFDLYKKLGKKFTNLDCEKTEVLNAEDNDETFP